MTVWSPESSLAVECRSLINWTWFGDACGFEKLVALSFGGFFVLVQFYNQPLIFSLLL
jgi:hypothetical protein